MNTHWPTANLDPVRRLRVMAAGLNAAMYAEAHLDLPLADIWAIAEDLEGELPYLVPTIRDFRCRPTGTDRFPADASGPLGHAARFDVVLQPGWCLMQTRQIVGGMAAVEEGDGCRFAVLGALRRPGSASLQKALRPLGRTRGHLMIERAAQRALIRRGRATT
ncbi:hypothetical protein ACIBM4_30210 [Streptomyces sp. NPDC050256]|uniref:hypothetical protein n=1 Tax=Streptomyces sp. NPDC050256 TaxID=3365607 RepID=UPI0037BE0534